MEARRNPKGSFVAPSAAKGEESEPGGPVGLPRAADLSSWQKVEGRSCACDSGSVVVDLHGLPTITDQRSACGTRSLTETYQRPIASAAA